LVQRIAATTGNSVSKLLTLHQNTKNGNQLINQIADGSGLEKEIKAAA